MPSLVLLLIPVALLVALLATWAARGVGRRLNALDGAGVAGQVKAAPRRVPNTGGVGIFLGFALPLLVMVIAVLTADTRAWLMDWQWGQSNLQRVAGISPATLAGLAESLREHAGWALAVLGGVLLLHLMGLVDDRKPLPAIPKLLAMVAVSLGVLVLTQTRMFTFVDGFAGGTWASYALTLVWILVITNAMNFLDNMDGLSGGVGAIASGSFMTIAIFQEQWFIAGCFALLLGALLGFLWFNKPGRGGGGASVFMGDGGSLVLGFLLAFLSVRITYATMIPDTPLPSSEPPIFDSARDGIRVYPFSTTWHAIFAPLVVLAIPLYDLTSVVLLRLRQGKNPMVGDLQHISHRFVQRGLSKPTAVAVIWGFAGAAGLAGILLTRTDTAGAILIATQVALLLLVLAAIEFAGGASAKPINKPQGAP